MRGETNILKNMKDVDQSWISITEIDGEHVVHKAILSGLATMKDYYYQLISKDYESDVFVFKIPGPKSLNEPIFMISDTQYGDIQYNRHLRNIAKNKDKPSILFHGGDIVEHYYVLKEYHKLWYAPLEYLFFDYGSMIRQIPIALVRGNHEDEDTYTLQYTISRSLWYAITISNIRFIVIDTNRDFPEQRVWFQKEINSDETKSAKFVVFLCHIPPYVEYWEKKAWERGEKRMSNFLQEYYIPLCEVHKIDMVISGHSHIYQRGARNGIKYMIIGGGGGDLETENGRVEDYNIYTTTKFEYHYVTLEVSQKDESTILLINTFDLSNNIIDTFHIIK